MRYYYRCLLAIFRDPNIGDRIKGIKRSAICLNRLNIVLCLTTFKTGYGNLNNTVKRLVLRNNLRALDLVLYHNLPNIFLTLNFTQNLFNRTSREATYRRASKRAGKNRNFRCAVFREEVLSPRVPTKRHNLDLTTFAVLPT